MFVLLDNVQFQKGGGAKGGNWANRVRALANGKATWLTVPVVRSYHGTRTIGEMEIDESRPWQRKMLRTLEQSYGRADSFDQIFPLLAELIDNPEGRLAAYNEKAIRRLAEGLRLDPGHLVRASELAASGKATDRLLAIVGEVGGSAYLSGAGAAGTYQDEGAFERAGIELVQQDFEQRPYPQVGSNRFHSGLSIVDALMNCGFDGTRRLLSA